VRTAVPRRSALWTCGARLSVDPSDWRRILTASTSGYAAAREHARRVDARLGLRVETIEAELLRRKGSGVFASTGDVQDWVGLDPQALLTPYSELLEMLERVGVVPGQTWVDLGAGYGRLGIVMGLLYPATRCLQYELVRERVEEGLRVMRELGLGSEQRLEVQDLTDPEFEIPMADNYFLYDYGSRVAVQKTIEDLRCLAQRRAITVIARGRGSRHWIESNEPWLSQVVPPEHAETYSVYRSA